MRVAVVGCGYVGVVSAVGLAGAGHDVVGIDSSAARIAALSDGRPPFAEPGLAPALRDELASGRFSVAATLETAARADVILLCVQTPARPDGGVDLRYLEGASEELASVLRSSTKRCVVAIRSTVPPGTNEILVAPRVADPGRVAVVSNPEFLREGSALSDFVQPDRIVLGVREAWATDVLRELYEPLGAPIIATTPPTAELAKYTSNAFLATLVSFSNEIARICEATPGVDVEDILGILHSDRRLTGADGMPAEIVSYLRAGCGFGGSCLPKDLVALSAYAVAAGEQPSLLEAVGAVNRGQAQRLVERAEGRLGSLERRRVAVLGAAFKAGTDDLRDSPAIRLIQELLRRRARIVVFDPLVAPAQLRVALGGAEVAIVDTMEAAVAEADACIVTTHAPEFERLHEVVASLNGDGPLIVDGRRTLAVDAFAEGAYLGVGRGVA